MITAGDLYKVLSAVVPLYIPMILGYGSLRWWKTLTPEECSGITLFVSAYGIPLLSFQYISTNNPYEMNVDFIAADVISKGGVLLLLGLWARYGPGGSMDWMITVFELATLPNTLVMGIPLLGAMYGTAAKELVIQALVMQCLVWYTLLLFLYELHAARVLIRSQSSEGTTPIESAVQAEAITVRDDGKSHVLRKSTSSSQDQGLDDAQFCETSNYKGLPSMPSPLVLRSRPSNLPGVQIWSLYSDSVSLTVSGGEHSGAVAATGLNDFPSTVSGGDNSPRQSNFTSYSVDFGPHNTPRQSNFTSYSVDSGRPNTPRQSNVTSSDVCSLHSPRRPSNLGEENRNHMHASASGTAAPRPSFILPVNYKVSENLWYLQRGGPYPTGTYPGSVLNVCSSWPTLGSKNGAEAKAPTELDNESAKDQHRFMQTSSISSVLAGNNDFVAVETSISRSNPAPEELLVRPQTGSTRNNVAGQVTRPNPNGYGHEDSSPNNSIRLDTDEVPDHGCPSFSENFGSDATSSRPEGDHKISTMSSSTAICRLIMGRVFRNLMRNPNTYASLFGLAWSLVSFRWHMDMPKLVDNSISIVSDAGICMTMFSLGLYMGLQKRLIVCGPSLAALSMAIRFISGPAAMAGASMAVGLKGNLFRAAIVQGALPQGIVPFIFAMKYNIHTGVLSTAVIFGLVVSLPITLVYYILLGL